jgi:hypothetical protein
MDNMDEEAKKQALARLMSGQRLSAEQRAASPVVMRDPSGNVLKTVDKPPVAPMEAQPTPSPTPESTPEQAPPVEPEPTATPTPPDMSQLMNKPWADRDVASAKPQPQGTEGDEEDLKEEKRRGRIEDLTPQQAQQEFQSLHPRLQTQLMNLKKDLEITPQEHQQDVYEHYQKYGLDLDDPKIQDAVDLAFRQDQEYK